MKSKKTLIIAILAVFSVAMATYNAWLDYQINKLDGRLAEAQTQAEQLEKVQKEQLDEMGKSLTVQAEKITTLTTQVNDLKKEKEDRENKEIDMLARIIYSEAGNQSDLGQRYVACVVLNRVDSSKFPNTIEGVLSQPNQFEGYKNKNYNRADIPERCYTNARLVYIDGLRELPANVMYFKEASCKTNWNLTFYQQVDSHLFFY